MEVGTELIGVFKVMLGNEVCNVGSHNVGELQYPLTVDNITGDDIAIPLSQFMAQQ